MLWFFGEKQWDNWPRVWRMWLRCLFLGSRFQSGWRSSVGSDYPVRVPARLTSPFSSFRFTGDEINQSINPLPFGRSISHSINQSIDRSRQKACHVFFLFDVFRIAHTLTWNRIISWVWRKPAGVLGKMEAAPTASRGSPVFCRVRAVTGWTPYARPMVSDTICNDAFYSSQCSHLFWVSFFSNHFFRPFL